MRDEHDMSGAGISGPLPYARPRPASGNGRTAGEAHRGEQRSRTHDEEPALSAALVHAYAAGKSVVADRLALIRVELARTVGQLATGGALLLGSSVLLVLGWFGFAVGAVLWMGVMWGTTLALWLRLLIAAAVTGAVGGTLLAIGLSALRARPAAGDASHTRPTRSAHAPMVTSPRPS